MKYKMVKIKTSRKIRVKNVISMSVSYQHRSSMLQYRKRYVNFLLGLSKICLFVMSFPGH